MMRRGRAKYRGRVKCRGRVMCRGRDCALGKEQATKSKMSKRMIGKSKRVMRRLGAK
ncbi:MAG: hypothetical protein IJ952_09515 [Alistipes sp.]|nr:hypothetical protein [Alistipes sp.]